MHFPFNFLLIFEINSTLKIYLGLRRFRFSNHHRRFRLLHQNSWTPRLTLFDLLASNSCRALKQLHTLKRFNLIMNLVQGRGPLIRLFCLLPLFFSLIGFTLYLLSNEFLGFFFEFDVENLVIMLHYTLHSHRTCNNIPKPCHPHISFIWVFGAKHKKPLRSLNVKWISPVFREVFLIDFTFW